MSNAIDLRGATFCNIGQILRGSIADEGLGTQQGVVRCRGNLELAGLYPLQPGTIVSIGFDTDGYISRLPRRLRVLSSFANPYKGITKLAVGDKLVYLENLRGEKADPDDPEEVQENFPEDKYDYDAPNFCYQPKEGESNFNFSSENTSISIKIGEVYPYAPQEAVKTGLLTIPGDQILKKCCAALGIGKSGTSLTAGYKEGEVDLSSGYVSVINNLLSQESLYGFLDANDILRVFPFSSSNGYGPQLTDDDIVDFDGLQGGELPGQRVSVRFKYNKISEDTVDNEKEKLDEKLDGDPSDEETDDEKLRNREKETTIGAETVIKFYWSAPYTQPTATMLEQVPGIIAGPAGDVLVLTVKFRPETVIETEYDILDRVIKRTTTVSSVVAAVAGNIVQAYCNKTTYSYDLAAPNVTQDQIFTLKNIPENLESFANTKVEAITQESFFYKTKAPLDGEIDLLQGMSDLGLQVCTHKNGEWILADAFDKSKLEEYEKAKSEAPYAEVTAVYEPIISVLGKVDIGDTSAIPPLNEVSAYFSTVVRTAEVDLREATAIVYPDRAPEDGTGLIYAAVAGIPFKSSASKYYQADAQYSSTIIYTDRWTMYSNTIEGQQKASTYARQILEARTTAGLFNYAKEQGSLYYLGTEVRIVEGREVNLQSRPAQNLLIDITTTAGQKDQDEQESVKIEEDTGDGEGSSISFDMPYAMADSVSWNSSDGLSWTGTNAYLLASRYARTQNAILRGNRYGITVKVPVRSMPAYPLSNVYVNLAGFTGAYKSSAMSWVFDGSGVVCSMDLLLTGAVGGAGAAWVPMAPGAIAPNTTGATTEGAGVPVNAAPTPDGFDASDPGGWLDTLPTDTAGQPLTSLTPYQIISPVNVIYEAIAGLRVGAVAEFIDWSQEEIVYEADAGIIISVFATKYSLDALAGSLTLTGKAAQTKNVLLAYKGTLSLTGRAAITRRNIPFTADAESFMLSGKNNSLSLDNTNGIGAIAGSFILDGKASSLGYPPLVWQTGTSNLSYSNSDKTATATNDSGKNAAAIAGAARNSGKWYVELILDNNSQPFTSAQTEYFGLITNTTVSLPGGVVWPYVEGAAFTCHNRTIQQQDLSATVPYNAFGAAEGSAFLVMIAVDFDNKKIWFGKTGTWIASGDPATGANPHVYDWAGSISLRPACRLYYNTDSCTINNPQTYSPPSGFSAWI